MRLGLGFGLGLFSGSPARHVESSVGSGSFSFGGGVLGATYASLPSDVSGLTVWCRGDVATGSPVSSWTDQSGNGNHLAQGTAGFRPTIGNSAAFNNLPVLTLDGSDDFLVTAGTVTYGPFTIFIVSKFTEHDYVWDHNGADYTYGAVGASFSVTRGATSSQKDVDPAAFWTQTGAAVTFRRSFDGTHAGNLLYKNGVLQATTNGAGTGDPGTGTSAQVLALGSTAAGALPIAGEVAEFIVYNRQLTAGEITLVEEYLRRRYAHY